MFVGGDFPHPQIAPTASPACAKEVGGLQEGPKAETPLPAQPEARHGYDFGTPCLIAPLTHTPRHHCKDVSEWRREGC